MRQINVRLRGQRFVTWRTSNESKSNQHPSNLNKIPMVSSFQLFCRKKSGEFWAPNGRGREDADSQLGGIQNHWPWWLPCTRDGSTDRVPYQHLQAESRCGAVETSETDWKKSPGVLWMNFGSWWILPYQVDGQFLKNLLYNLGPGIQERVVLLVGEDGGWPVWQPAIDLSHKSPWPQLSGAWSCNGHQAGCAKDPGWPTSSRET